MVQIEEIVTLSRYSLAEEVNKWLKNYADLYDKIIDIKFFYNDETAIIIYEVRV